MFDLSLAAVSAVPVTASAIAADDGAKPARTGDDFAALLGIQVAVAAGETKAGPDIARAALPKGGKTLPVVAEVEPETAETPSPELPATDNPASLPQIALSVLPFEAFALAPATSTERAAVPVVTTTAARLVAAAPAILTSLATGGSKPIEADPQLTSSQPEHPALHAQLPAPAAVAKPDGQSETPPVPKDDAADKPAPGRPSMAPQFTLPAQASARAVLLHSETAGQDGGPIKLPPTLPEQASAQATIALAARGNPERPARLPQVAAAIAIPTDGETPSALPLTPLHPLKAVLAEPPAPADLPPALASVPADGDPQSTPQTAAPAPSGPPAPARHDFAAMIDRLFEARDMAGAQPVAMTLRHDDFGAVSLNFRAADDGLTVTMASPDPDFARAVNAAAASGAAAGTQGDPARQGGEPASSRQHAGSSAGGSAAGDDLAGQSRAGSREAERDGSRQRRDQSPPQRNTPRQQGRSGIFA